MTNLFQKKRFQMSGGGWSDFKLECDALTPPDYDTLGYLTSRVFAFGEVYGVPTGGTPIANAFRPYATPSERTLLIVDDVLTTGGSMVKARDELAHDYPDWIIRGLVVFARGPVPAWITPIFTLNPSYWQND